LGSGMFETVKSLTELPGVSGHEELVMEWLREHWEPYAEQAKIVGSGNLIARIGGQGPKLLVEAHADEIGLFVRSVDEAGFVWLSPRHDGASTPRKHGFVVGQPALVQTERGIVEGVFATITGHVTPPSFESRAELDWERDVFIDIGARSREDAEERGVGIGDGVVWGPTTRRIGRLITGKAMDDRAGLAIMTELLPQLDMAQCEYELYLGATTQEEMRLVGAESLERDGRFDMAIAVEVGLSGDVPGVSPVWMPNKLGDGPQLIYKDGRMNYNRKLTKALADVAESSNIPIQKAVYTRFSGDGVQLIRHGVPTAMITFPTRYTHSPFESVDQGDLEQTVELLRRFLCTPPPTALW